MAPDAQLLSFKVFADVCATILPSTYSSPLTSYRQDPWDTDEDVLIQAFCDAYGAGVKLSGRVWDLFYS